MWVEGIQRIVCGVTEKTTCQVRKIPFIILKYLQTFPFLYFECRDPENPAASAVSFPVNLPIGFLSPTINPVSICFELTSSPNPIQSEFGKNREDRAISFATKIRPHGTF